MFKISHGNASACVYVYLIFVVLPCSVPSLWPEEESTSHVLLAEERLAEKQFQW